MAAVLCVGFGNACDPAPNALTTKQLSVTARSRQLQFIVNNAIEEQPVRLSMNITFELC